MKNKSLRSKIAMYAIAGAMAVSGVAGATLPASASSNPNTDNTKYTFSNTSASGDTSYRRKYNNTKVYVYPTVGPQLYYRVKGSVTLTGDGVYRSSPVTIPLGVQASITNLVNEKGGLYAKLHLSRTKAVHETTIGWWSPDSTKNYTVFP